MKIDVYANVVCPWCYVGEKRLEKALRERPDLDVELRGRSSSGPRCPREGCRGESSR